MLEIFLIAVSLALDAFAVSVSCGLTAKKGLGRLALKLGICFGAFQFVMPLLGWFLGSQVASYIEKISPWVAFGLLALIGGRMILEAFRGEDTPETGASDASRTGDVSLGKLLALGVATSIDALAVGVTFALVEVNVLLACGVIGAVAFALSVLGAALGKKLGSRFQRQAGILGGVVLVAIGLKILLENLLGK